MNRWNNLRTRHQNRQGTATVELAVVLGLIFTIVFGTIEACNMIHLTQTLYIASYEATRTSLIPKSQESDVIRAANEVLISRNVKGAVINVSPSNFASADIGTTITVSVAAPASSNSPLASLFYSGRNLTGTCSMMKEY